jgi:hypothetical protein
VAEVVGARQSVLVRAGMLTEVSRVASPRRPAASTSTTATPSIAGRGPGSPRSTVARGGRRVRRPALHGAPVLPRAVGLRELGPRPHLR